MFLKPSWIALSHFVFQKVVLCLFGQKYLYNIVFIHYPLCQGFLQLLEYGREQNKDPVFVDPTFKSEISMCLKKNIENEIN